ncbi:MAGE family-domain-containing protein [Immersiella caudata]|uniref:MAGE family-domain-containing protein n=1 Tax=Immersiella caudata TaxID=314043 RepID=A0AA40CCZ4_9PEZI|nr:MAGE family-domain-containing protein [Immersiella caudata]
MPPSQQRRHRRVGSHTVPPHHGSRGIRLTQQRQAVEEESDNDAEIQSPSSEDADGDGDTQMGGVGPDSTRDLIKQLVRYALACEFSRTPIRRDGIREKVLGRHGREFRKVFNGAQEQLRAKFGMEMVELPVRDRNLLTADQKRKAAKSQSQKEAASNAYVLVSTLPEEYRTPGILPPSKVHSADGEAAYTALYAIIIAIIQLSGGELSDPRLRRHLQRLNAAQNMPSANPMDPHSPSEKTEFVLQKMVKQQYLVKVTEKGQNDEEGSTWHVGPRGKVEVDNESIAQFVRSVYGGGTEDLEKRLEATLKVRKRDAAPPPVAEAEEDGAAHGDPGPSSRRRSGRRAAAQAEEEDDE